MISDTSIHGSTNSCYENLDMQIQVLYSTYGWEASKIAAQLNIATAVVEYSIKHNQLVQAPSQTEDTDVQVMDQLQCHINQQAIKAKLQSNELAKQQQIAPYLALTELNLLQRIAEASQKVSHPDDIGTLVSAFKKLTQDSVINAIVTEEKTKGAQAPQVAVQVINRFDNS